MSSLRDRLQRIRRTGESSPKAPGGGPGGPGRDFLPDWERMGEFLFRRREHHPLPPGFAEEIRGAADFFLDGTDPSTLLFYDTETTGLSGGAGTLVFLAGFASLEKGEIRSSQYFLADFPGEGDFLRALCGEFDQRSFMLSYNGRSFDAPLLRTRLVMNRIPRELPAQFDLLYPARRLWRRILPDCRLSTLENQVLGRGRVGDIPGAEIPGLYFDYLAWGNPVGLEAVIDHNREDVLSLVHLLAYFGRVLREGNPPGEGNPQGEEAPEAGAPSHPVDRAALGGLLLPRLPRRGLFILDSAARTGDLRARQLLSRFYKRNRMWSRAEALWRQAPEEDEFSRLELAKYCEHRLRAWEEALEITEGLLRCPGNAARERELLHRRERLKRKIRRGAGGKPDRGASV